MLDKSRLKSQLLASGIQQTNNALFQVINQLLDSLVADAVSSSSALSAVSGKASANADFLTHTDESGILPNSRRLIAGTGITFNDAVANQRTISSTGGQEWSVLTDGDLIEPELIYAGGDVVMVHVP